MKKILSLTLGLFLLCHACPASADVFSDMAKKDLSTYGALKKGKSQAEKLEIDKAAAQHEDPAVRALPYTNISRNYASDSEELKFFTGLLKKEQDPKVLALGLRCFMNNLKVSNDLYEFYKKCASHPDAGVRKGAMAGLVNTNNKSVAGIEAEAVKFLDDKDENVCQDACKELARANNALALDKIDAFIKANDPAKAKLLGKCAEGLTSLWYYAPFFNTFDARAYKMTLAYLKLAPRSKDLPVWQVIAPLRKAPKPDWEKLANGVYKGSEVAAVLADIAKDKAADRMTREYAIEAIAIHGTKADLEALAQALGDDKVAKKIEKAMQSAK